MNRVIYILITALLTACSFSKKTGNTTVSDKESEKIAQVKEVEVLNLNLVYLTMDGRLYIAKDVEVTLIIDIPGMSYSGKAACNSYFGSLEIVGEDAIKFLPGGSTEMMCEAEAMQWQARVFNALIGHTFNISTKRDTTALEQVDGDIKMWFEEVESIRK